MAVVASLPGLNLFSSFPSKPPLTDPPAAASKPAPLPIPIPKYPPKITNPKNPKPLKSRKDFPKPVSEGVITREGDRSVVVGESGVSYLLPGAPFEFQYSYSETPNVKPLAIREPAFLPFAPPTLPRPWTGKAPLKTKKSKKKVRLFEPLNPPPEGVDGAKLLQTRRPISMGNRLVGKKTREEILGEPLTRKEVTALVKPLLKKNRQVNLGRDGLTHNMLELVHAHWKNRPVCKVRCKGVPTVDMNNVCRHLEEKSGGKVIFQHASAVFLFRGRNYDRFARPQYPLMLWKPAAPVYPKLIEDAPEGLTKDEADELRMKGKKLIPICKLGKNGFYSTLVKDVRNAFEGCELVKINCAGMKPTDYKKLGAKLKDLVPCVLLSFDDEQVLMWRGKDSKSMHRDPHSISDCFDGTGFKISADPNIDVNVVRMGSRLASLWKQAIESSEALVLDDTTLGPDSLLKKVEEFEAISQAAETSQDSWSGFAGSEDDEDDDALGDSEAFEEWEPTVPYGSLPVDAIAQFGESGSLEE